MDQNLGIPILPAIKLRISLRRLINADLMTDDKRWFGPPRDNHIAQVAIVGLDVALARSDCEAL
jgi:hypothetical protein